MNKKRLLFLLFFYGCLGLSLYAMKKGKRALTNLDFAKVSQYTYVEDVKTKENPLKKKGYRLFKVKTTHKGKQVGFKGIALKNDVEKKVVIGYRGTDPCNVKNLFADLGIFCDEEQEGNSYETIFNQLCSWLLKYNKAWYFAFWAATLGVSWSKKYEKAIEFFLNKVGKDLHISSDMKWYTHQGVAAAKDFYDSVQSQVGSDYTTYLTGHSLGGGYAQIVGGRFRCPTVTFNAPGMLPIYQRIYKQVIFFLKA